MIPPAHLYDGRNAAHRAQRARLLRALSGAGPCAEEDRDDAIALAAALKITPAPKFHEKATADPE